MPHIQWRRRPSPQTQDEGPFSPVNDDFDVVSDPFFSFIAPAAFFTARADADLAGSQYHIPQKYLFLHPPSEAQRQRGTG